MCPPKRKRIGRPRKNTIKKVITLYLDPEVDADILAFLEANPTKQARAILRAMRAGIQPGIESNESDLDQLAADDLLGNWDF